MGSRKIRNKGNWRRMGIDRCVTQHGNLTMDVTVEHWVGRNPDAVARVTTDEPLTLVVFRKFKDTGDIIALFPEEEWKQQEARFKNLSFTKRG